MQDLFATLFAGCLLGIIGLVYYLVWARIDDDLVSALVTLTISLPILLLIGIGMEE